MRVDFGLSLTAGKDGGKGGETVLIRFGSAAALDEGMSASAMGLGPRQTAGR